MHGLPEGLLGKSWPFKTKLLIYRSIVSFIWLSYYFEPLRSPKPNFGKNCLGPSQPANLIEISLKVLKQESTTNGNAQSAARNGVKDPIVVWVVRTANMAI